MKATIGLVIVIVGVVVTFNVIFSGGNGEPVAPPTPTAKPTVTAAPTSTATVQPISSAPVRVQFDLGSYGETITGTVSTQYLLWAKAGQAFTTTLSANTTALASLYAPNGGALFDNVRGGDLAAVTLPTDGDYRLEIRSSGNYTVGVMIR